MTGAKKVNTMLVCCRKQRESSVWSCCIESSPPQLQIIGLSKRDARIRIHHRVFSGYQTVYIYVCMFICIYMCIMTPEVAMWVEGESLMYILIWHPLYRVLCTISGNIRTVSIRLSILSKLHALSSVYCFRPFHEDQRLSKAELYRHFQLRRSSHLFLHSLKY